MLDEKTNHIYNNCKKDNVESKHTHNSKNHSYKQTTMYKFMQSLSDGLSAIGEGMEKQHDEDLMIKKKP